VYADDIVVRFEHEAEARRFWDAMRNRFEDFALSLHPETFKFLGFVFICERTRRARLGAGDVRRYFQPKSVHSPSNPNRQPRSTLRYCVCVWPL